MPSQPPDPGWTFNTVYDLLGADSHDVADASIRQERSSASRSSSEGGVGLGNFDKLYETLGWPDSTVAPPLPPLDESELSNSDDLLLSPVLEASTQPDRKVDTQSPDHETSAAGLTKKQRRKARKEAERILQERLDKAAESDVFNVTTQTVSSPKAQHIVPVNLRSKSPTKQDQNRTKSRSTSPVKAPALQDGRALQTPQATQRPTGHKRSKSSKSLKVPVTLVPARNASSFLAPPATNQAQHIMPVTPVRFDDPLFSYFQQVQTPATAVPSSHTLVPRTVLAATTPRQAPATMMDQLIPVTPTPVLLPPYSTPQPTITLRSQVDRHFNLFTKLLTCFPLDRSWLVAPRQLVNETTAAEGIHIFFDASNILIGFKDMLRNSGIQPYDIAFDSLALLMERRRPVAKRVLVGSHREANPLPQVQKLIETSKAVGYECNVQEQVYIVREQSEKKKFFNDVKRLGWQKASQMRVGSGSDSETGPAAPKTPSAPKWVEQGVDELLHLKMCQSIIDTEKPTTMVLGTGDGAAAEMSDGFLAHVERAMRNGWKVELITWKQQTNGGYKRKAFRQKWGEQFTIIELDDFLEDLIDTP